MRKMQITLPEKPLKPSQCRRWLRRVLADNFPVMVKEFLERAPAQSCTHLKLVTDLLEAPAKQARRGKGEGERMLEELNRM